MTNRPLSVAEQALALNKSRPRPPTPGWIQSELDKCRADPIYFIDTYCYIYDNATSKWIPFKLWPAQIDVIVQVMGSKYTVVLKARQEGLSWLLGDCLALWFMLFRPIAEVLIFSQQEREAFKLLARMKGINGSESTFKLLPDWMKPNVIVDSAHEFRLDNGSGAQALPASAGGRSNAATYVVADESDFIEKFSALVNAATPTIDAGANKMVALSTANIDTPNSYFQRLYKSARDGQAEDDEHTWTDIFLPWMAHPGRTRAWYDGICRKAMATEGTLDSVYKEYPETADQALSARSLNKRFPPHWLTMVMRERKPLPIPADAPPHNGLRLYRLPENGKRYGLGLDPAGGSADSDDSAACVVDAETQEQVAVMGGKVEPTQFANWCADLSVYYNDAPILYEANNHGHAVLSQLRHRKSRLRSGLRRNGTAGDPGWLTLERNKNMLYDVGAKVMQQIVAEAVETGADAVPIIFDAVTMQQLASIDINELKAPEGDHDDYAMAWVLAQMCVYRGTSSMTQQGYTGLYSGRDEPREGHPMHPLMAQLVDRPSFGGPPMIPAALLDALAVQAAESEARQGVAKAVEPVVQISVENRPYEDLYAEMLIKARFRGNNHE